jgi:AmiR/NasT family two-component response regulator
MSVDLSVDVAAAPVQRFDVLTVLDQVQARVRSAEDEAAGLERALLTTRRIGMAVGILMCRQQLTEDQAVAVPKTHGQHCNVKLRELAETVIDTGTL